MCPASPIAQASRKPLGEDLLAELDALVADLRVAGRGQSRDLVPTLAAEGCSARPFSVPSATTAPNGVSACSPLESTSPARLTQRSQMKTPGPVTSRRVLRCGRPQNEQSRTSLVSFRLRQRRPPPASSTI